MKPLINLEELEFEACEPNGDFEESYCAVSPKIGALKLGYNVTVVPPGKKSGPYHNHHHNEEMFLILEGTGLLRFGGKEYPLRAQDLIACPPGGRDVAHQILNNGDVPLKYLALSTMEPVEIAEFPDSDKVMSFVGTSGVKKKFRHIARTSESLDYFDGES